jgi:hypothetical protein
MVPATHATAAPLASTTFIAVGLSAVGRHRRAIDVVRNMDALPERSAGGGLPPAS